MISRSTAVLCACLLCTAAFAATPPVNKPAHAAATGHSAADDAQLEKAIRARFARSKISVNHFVVHVQGGTATIEGRADVMQHKGVATRLARTCGASEVVNRIEVSQAARDKAAASLSKGRQPAEIKHTVVN